MSFLNPELKLVPGNYAVIFISERETSLPDYDAMDEATMDKAEAMDGYLGYEVVRNGKQAIFISYWRDRATVDPWRQDALHRDAKSQAPQWYDAYRSIICPIESARLFRSESSGA